MWKKLEVIPSKLSFSSFFSLSQSLPVVSLPPIHGNAAGNEPTGSYRNCTAILMRCGFKVRRLHNNFLSVTVFFFLSEESELFELFGLLCNINKYCSNK